MAACSFSQTKSYCCFSPVLRPTRSNYACISCCNYGAATTVLQLRCCNYGAALHAATAALHFRGATAALHFVILRHCPFRPARSLLPLLLRTATRTATSDFDTAHWFPHSGCDPTHFSCVLRGAIWCGPTASPSQCGF